MPNDDATPARRALLRSPVVRAGIYAWSVIGLVVAVVLLGEVIGRLRLVVIPLAVALFPAAILSPLNAWLRNRGVHRTLSASVVVVGFVAALVGIVSAIGWFVAQELEDVGAAIEGAYEDARQWITDRVNVTIPSGEEIVETVRSWSSAVDVQGFLVATAEMVAGVLLGLVALFFYLRDGDRFGRFAIEHVPLRHRARLAEMGRRVWDTLGGYFRGQIVVAAVDAVFIGLGLFLLGVPLAAPLALLVFFGGMIPILGAFTAGAVAVLVALAEGGIGLAIAVLVLNVAVQQLEGNLLEPVIVGRATQLHPLAVLAAVTGGAAMFGLVGAFLAVPVVASVVRAVGYLLEELGPPEIEGHDATPTEA